MGATKYRKNLFYDDNIRERLKCIIKEQFEKNEHIELIESTVAYNHIHVLVKTELDTSRVGQLLFGVTSRLLRKEFPVLIDRCQRDCGGSSWGPIVDEKHLK